MELSKGALSLVNKNKHHKDSYKSMKSINLVTFPNGLSF